MLQWILIILAFKCLKIGDKKPIVRHIQKSTEKPEAIACAEDWRPLRSEGDGGGGLLGMDEG